MAQSNLCIAYQSIIENISNETRNKDSLIVFAIHSEPYVYIEDGQVVNGVEYHLVKMIGNALNKDVLFITGDMHKAIDNNTK